jgi:hypothetical protein
MTEDHDWAAAVPDASTAEYAAALLPHLVEQIQEAAAAGNPAERLARLAAAQQELAWATYFAMDDCRRVGQSWPTISKVLGGTHTTLLRQYEAGGPVVLARPGGPAGDDGRTALHEASIRVLNALNTVPVSAFKGADPAELAAAAQELSRALTRADAGTLLAAADRLLAASGTSESSLLTAAKSRAYTALRDLRVVVDRDRKLIMAIATTRDSVIVEYGDAEAIVPLTDGSKIFRMRDMAVAVLGLPKEQRGALALFQGERQLEDFALARDYEAPKIKVGDRLVLGPRPQQ